MRTGVSGVEHSPRNDECRPLRIAECRPLRIAECRPLRIAELRLGGRRIGDGIRSYFDSGVVLGTSAINIILHANSQRYHKNCVVSLSGSPVGWPR